MTWMSVVVQGSVLCRVCAAAVRAGFDLVRGVLTPDAKAVGPISEAESARELTGALEIAAAGRIGRIVTGVLSVGERAVADSAAFGTWREFREAPLPARVQSIGVLIAFASTAGGAVQMWQRETWPWASIALWLVVIVMSVVAATRADAVAAAWRTYGW